MMNNHSSHIKGNIDGNLGQALLTLKDNLDMMDQRSVEQVGNALATAIESLSPAQRSHYKEEIGMLIGALESRILGLEQDVRDARDQMNEDNR